MFPPHCACIQLQAGNENFGNHCICRLYDLVGLAAKRTPELLQGAMNHAAKKLPQLFGKAQHCQLLQMFRTHTSESKVRSPSNAATLHQFQSTRQILFKLIQNFF